MGVAAAVAVVVVVEFPAVGGFPEEEGHTDEGVGLAGEEEPVQAAWVEEHQAMRTSCLQNKREIVKSCCGLIMHSWMSIQQNSSTNCYKSNF